MKKNESSRYTIFSSIILSIAMLFSIAYAGVEPAPPQIAAALFLKLCTFEKNISGSGKDLNVYVVGSPDLLKAIETTKGIAIGKSKVGAVSGGSGAPASKPDIIIIDDESKLDEITAYSRANSVMTFTNNPDLVAKGVSLGVGVGDDKKPKIMINLTATNEENLNFNAAIMKVAQQIK